MSQRHSGRSPLQHRVKSDVRRDTEAEPPPQSDRTASTTDGDRPIAFGFDLRPACDRHDTPCHASRVSLATCANKPHAFVALLLTVDVDVDVVAVAVK